MLMRTIVCVVVLAFALASCGSRDQHTADDQKKAIEEIQKAEADFNKMAADKGLAEAFWFYADSNATIKRDHDSLIHGKDGIRNYYSAPIYAQASVIWAPDFTNASEKGDFGYTYGKYTWQSKDSAGKLTEFKGIFHTVWKKQADGTWKYVWD